MGRRLAKIKLDVIWKTTDDPNAILPWVKATEILLRAAARHDAYMQQLEKEDPTAFLVENLISFARKQEETLLHTLKGVPFYVEVPMDMVRQNKGFLYVMEATRRTRNEPLDSLTNVIERYLQTKSLTPADYSDATRNALYTLALLGLFLAHRLPDPSLSDADMP